MSQQIMSILSLGDLAGNTFARVVKKVDQTVNNSTVLVDDDELFVLLDANKIYTFLSVTYLISAPVTNFKHNWNIPTGATGNHTAAAWASNVTQNATALEPGGIGISVGDTTIQMVMTLGRIIMGGTAGNLQYEFAQNVATAIDTKCLQGSSLVVWEELP